MKSLWFTACLVSAGVLASGVGPAAADDQGTTEDQSAMMDAWMAAAQPGEPHAYLAAMAGDWKTRTTHYDMGEAQEPTEGTAHFEPILGGRVVQGTYKGEMFGQPFEGMSLDGYDNISGKYWSTWIDNSGTALYVTHGKMLEDGKTLEHTGPMQMPDGSEGSMRFVTTRKSDDAVTMTAYMTMPGSDEETLQMIMEFTRAGS